MIVRSLNWALCLCVGLILMVSLSAKAEAATPPCGQQLSAAAVYDGVPAYSNGIDMRCKNDCGSCAGRDSYGLRYQCVELIVRYAAKLNAGDPNFNIKPWLGTNAVDFFDKDKAAAIGWTRIVNGAPSTVDPPQPGDIIVFKAKDHKYGHIAIVKSVSQDGNTVTIVEQNWSDTGVATLTRKQGTGSRYELNPRWIYKVRGWLRKPTNTASVPLNNLSFQISPSNPALYFSGCGYYCGSTFDATRVMDPSVVKVGETYYMYYTGLPFFNDYQMGLATSVDGVTWTRSQANPVLNQGMQSWSDFRVEYGKVLYDKGTFKVWYVGDNQNLGATDYLGYATSTNGINWTPYSGNPIHTGIAAPGLRVVGVAKLSGTYYLYWRAGSSNLNVSTSSDGVHWTDSPNNPIVPYPGSGVIQTANSILLFTNDGYVAQSSDGIHFTFSSQPVAPQAVSAALIENNLLKVWFTKGDGHVNWPYENNEIDYATAPLGN